jgi:hypothetical protein
MNSDRWQNIIDLAEAAAELEQGQRYSFLDQACAADEGLRKEVESLLAFDAQAKSFIEAPAFEMAAELLAGDHAGSIEDQVVDAYKLGGLPDAEEDRKKHLETERRLQPGDERMSRLTLRFSGELEGEFCRDYFQKSLKQARYAVLVGLFLYTVFGLLDRLLVPEATGTIWIIRYVIVCPMVIGTYLLSFSKLFRKTMQLSLTAMVTIAGLGVIAMTAIAKPPANYLYYAGLMLVTIFGCTFARLRVPYAAASSFINVVAYEVVAITISQSPGPILANNSFFLISATLIGMSANYSMEFYMRRNFIQRRIIEARTAELQETNQDLILKNDELAQSRAELLRSIKRTQLVFSALSEALPGTVLDDKYRLEEKIGAGGFGTVYKATHILLQSSVAVKVFSPGIGNDALKDLERFRLEGISTCRLHHPNAVSVIDFGVSAASIAYLVMELLTGCTLKEELDKKGTMSISRSIKILQPVCSVLAEAHAAGVIHRDVKPSNVFLHAAKEGEIVKLVDFGVAKLMADTLDPGMQNLTQTGSFIGTPLYMSPERLTNLPYDGQADVYSIGIMAYEMLCGRLPFESSKENYWSVVLMQVNETPVLPRKVNPEIPMGLEDLIMAALDKSPDRRPSAKQLEQRLAEFVEPHPN